MSLTPRHPPATPGHGRRENGQRSTSLASTPLLPEQFKEAFSLLDKDGDGQINKQDLSAMWTSLGQPKDDAHLEKMLSELPTPLNFAAYFTAMTSMLSDMSSRDDLMAALMTFDEDDSGKVDLAEFKEALTTGRDAMAVEHVDQVLHGYTRKGMFNYNAFVENIAGAG